MKLSKESVINHFRYSFWIYILVVVLSIIFWDIIYTATEYRAPENKKIEWYLAENSFADIDSINLFMQKAKNEELQDMEEMNAVLLLNSATDFSLADVQFSTYIMSGQGDVYLLNKDMFKNYAAEGAFLKLDNYIDTGKLVVDKINVDSAFVILRDTENHEEGIYGIPAEYIEGLKDFKINTNNMYLAILYNSQNDDNCIKFLNYLINKLK